MEGESDIPVKDRRFVLLPVGQHPHIDSAGHIISEGVLGRIPAINAYLTAYASYSDSRRPVDLLIGECLPAVRYSLSGSVGAYDVWRVA